MNILVTGVAGFIGSHTAERLCEAGHKVIGIDNFNDYYSLELKELNSKSLIDKGVQIVKQDLRNERLSDFLPTDIHYVFHFAAQPGISASSTFEDYFTIIKDGTPCEPDTDGDGICDAYDQCPGQDDPTSAIPRRSRL